MHWFLSLPPETQTVLILQAVGFVFSCGVYYATIQSLKNTVVRHDKKLEEHDGKLEEHGEQITRLEAFRQAGRHGR